MVLNRITSRPAVFILLLVIGMVFLVLSIFSEGSHAGADDIFHYLHARWGYKHPELLLDHWAKPFFTLIASPFAQFGFTGVKIMNLLLGLGSAWLVKVICDKLNYPRSVLAMVMTLFMPVYLIMMLGANNEIMTSFMIILIVYLFLSEKYVFASVILSFLPLVRNETIVLFPFVLLAFLIKKRYKALPFIFTGFLIYSIIGYFFYNDFFWLVSKVPYTGDAEFLGRGDSLFYFIRKYYSIFGIPLTITLVAGISYWIYRLVRNPLHHWQEDIIPVLLILLPMIIFFFAHSYVWWKGIGNSGGRIRVMACIVPLASIVSLQGYNFLAELFNKIHLKSIPFVLGLLFILYVLYYPFKIHKIPIPADNTQQYLEEAYNWLDKNDYIYNRKIYLQDPRFMKYFKGDPFAKEEIVIGIPNIVHPETRIETGDLIIYDVHFAWFDSGIDLTNYFENGFFELIKIVQPEIPVNLFDIKDFDTYIYIFERIGIPKSENSEKLKEYQENITTENLMLIKDMNLLQDVYLDKNLIIKTDSDTHDEFFSYCYILNKDSLFSPGIELSYDDIKKYNKSTFYTNCTFKSVDLLALKEIYLVMSFENGKYPQKKYLYKTYDLSRAKSSDKEWINVQLAAILKKRLKKNAKLKVYIWNPGKKEILIKDLGLYYKE
ncbi:hypothetical protein ES705_09686 [subsurface metagenome]